MQQSNAGKMLFVFIEPEETENLTAGMPDPPFTVRDEASLIELLSAGLNSGPALTMTAQDWEDIRQEVHRRHIATQGNSQIAEQCAKLDPPEKQALADVGLVFEVAQWPLY